MIRSSMWSSSSYMFGGGLTGRRLLIFCSTVPLQRLGVDVRGGTDWWQRLKRRRGLCFLCYQTLWGSVIASLYISKKKSPCAQKREGVHPADVCAIRQANRTWIPGRHQWFLSGTGKLSPHSKTSSHTKLRLIRSPAKSKRRWLVLPSGQIVSGRTAIPERGWCLSELSCSYFPHITAFCGMCVLLQHSGSVEELIVNTHQYT